MGLGILLAIVATFGWGLGDVFVRRAMFGARAETVTVVLVAMVVVSLGAVGVVSVGFEPFASRRASFFGLTALMGLLTWITGNLLYFHGMRRAGVLVAAPVLGIAPLFGIFLAVTFGGERPSALTLLGAAAIVTGVLAVLTDRNRVPR